MATDVARHLLDEVAIDGDVGCSLPRLNEFIDWYQIAHPEVPQLDEALRSFVISALLRHPTIRAGCAVIAKPTIGESAVKAGKKRARTDDDNGDDDEDAGHASADKVQDAPSLVELAPEPMQHDLNALIKVYGDDLRVVADEDAILTAVAGNVRPINAAQRRFLVLVARSRSDGISFTTLTKELATNTQNIFFHTKSLEEKSLVVRMRSELGKGPLITIVLSTRFAHLNEVYCNFQKSGGQERGDDESANVKQEDLDEVALERVSDEALESQMCQNGNAAGEDEADSDEEAMEEDGDEREEVREDTEDEDASAKPDRKGLTLLAGVLAFPPMKTKEEVQAFARDRVRVRLRVLRLCKESKNHIIETRNLVVRLGVREYNRAERRSVQAILEPLQAEGLVRRRWVWRTHRSGTKRKASCVEMTEAGLRYYEDRQVTRRQVELRNERAVLVDQLARRQSALCLEVTVERQLVECVAQAGPAGLSIDELNPRFGGNEERKRDLERFLGMCKSAPAPSYRDLMLSSALQQRGRLRSYRYWTQQWRPKQATSKETEQTSLTLAELQSPVTMPVEQRASSARSLRKLQREQTAVRMHGSEPSSSKSKKKSALKKGARGRPRKFNTPKALAAAARYQEKKAEAARAAKQARDVSSSASSSSSATSSSEEEEGEDEEEEEASIEGNGNASSASAAVVKQTRFANNVEEAGTGTAESDEQTQSGAQQAGDETTETVSATDARANRGAAVKNEERVNITMQLKQDKLLSFLQSVRVVELSHMGTDYMMYLDGQGITSSKRAPYEMDSKTRMRLLGKLEKSGSIQSMYIVGPPPAGNRTKQKKATIYYATGTSMDEVLDLGRKISEGTIRQHRSMLMHQSQARPALESEEVERSLGFSYSVRHNFDVGADTLSELLDEPKYRDQLLRITDVRSHYTGRLHGKASRMQFLHELVWMKQGNTFSQGAIIVDLTWWTSEATFGECLRLLKPPMDEGVLQASQNRETYACKIARLPLSLREALRLHRGAESEGLSDISTDVIPSLMQLGLVTPVTKRDESYVVTAYAPQHLLFRFEPSASLYGWKGDRLMRSQETVSFAAVDELRSFWTSLSRNTARLVQSNSTLLISPREADQLDAGLRSMLLKSHSWIVTYRMLEPQRIFLQRSIQLGVDQSALDDDAMLAKLGHASLTPKLFVKRFLMRFYGLTSRLRPGEDLGPSEKHRTLASQAASVRSLLPPSSFVRKPGRPKMDPIMQPLTKRQAKRIKKRAKAVFDVRAREFDDVVEQFMRQDNIAKAESDILIEGLQRARKAYGDGQPYMTMDHVQQLFEHVGRLNESGRVDSYNAVVRRTRPPATHTTKKKQESKRRVDAVDAEGIDGGGDGAHADDGPLLRSTRGRKSTLEWTEERNELLRDCGVILRARDRYRNASGTTRKNWVALKQVFEGTNTSALRSRFEKLQDAVGEEAYLAQLEVEWERLWTQYRGTEALPDRNPRDPSAFDLNAHVAFLQRNINKYEVQEVLRRGTDEPVPLDASKLDTIYDFDRPAAVQFLIDPTSLIARRSAGDTVNDMRNYRLVRFAFTTGMFGGIDEADTAAETQTSAPHRLSSRQSFLAEAVVKMVLSTDEERYEERSAAAFCLENDPDGLMEQACRALRHNGIIKAKASGEGARRLPGRGLAWHDECLAFMNESNLDTLPLWETIATATKVLRDDTSGKPLTVYRDARDEQAAAAVLLLDRQGAVEVDVDLSPIYDFSYHRLFNAKRLTDAHLEMRVSLTSAPHDAAASAVRKHFAALHHRLDDLIDGDPAPDAVLVWLCFGAALQDVQACWRRSIDSIATDVSRRAHSRAVRVLEALNNAGLTGLNRAALHSMVDDDDDNESATELADVVQRMLSSDPPSAFEAEHDGEVVLVAAAHLEPWTIRAAASTVASSSTTVRLLPRAWFDMYGQVNARMWHASVALILHAIIVHPGVTLAHIVAQMRSGALTRSDVVRVIAMASEAGLVEYVWSEAPDTTGARVCWLAKSDAEIALRSTEAAPISSSFS